MTPRYVVMLTLSGLAIAACAPSGPVASQAGSVRSEPASPGASRTLVAAVRVEPNSLATRSIQTATGFAGFALVRRLANAELTLLDDRLVRHPYLAEALPRLHTESWRVSSDGQMETTWRLKPAIVWHDGAPLSAEDFVFAWRVYATPEFGAAGSQSIRAIQEVAAMDDQTLAIRYRQPYPHADNLTGSDGFPPLPRHLLEPSFQQGDSEAFANRAYWRAQYVGLGPYRLERWEPGSFLEGVAFDRHVLGAPRIGRVKVFFITDPNTALANILAGELDFLGDTAIVLDQAFTLKGDWEPRGAGTVRLRASQWRATAFQFRPELANPRSILDLRIRRALAHAVDKQALNESMFRGEMVISDFLISPQSAWGPSVTGALVKYPYDLRLSEQLMSEAGFVKGPGAFFMSSAEGRFRAELKTTVDREAEMFIMASEWRKSGFDIQDAVLPAALSIDPESRVTFPAMFTSITAQGEQTLSNFTTAQIPRAENRWRSGNNRGGWSNPEYDRLFDAFSTTLEPGERAAEMAQMAKIFTEELPVISLLFLAQPYAHVAALRGVLPVAPEGDITWNIHQWAFR